jgi:PII-like signaling protein
MERLTNASKLTIFVGGDARRDHRPLYQVVVDILLEHHVAGVTVTKGAMSYGGRRMIHSAQNEITMTNLPIIVEAVDRNERIASAAEQIATVIGEHGLTQIQPTMIVTRGSEKRSEG